MPVLVGQPQLIVIGNERGIGLGGIARPDPKPLPHFLDRKGAHAHVVGDAVLRWDFQALAFGTEFDAVIRTLNAVADDLALRQRR